jgi:hypothetical protein
MTPKISIDVGIVISEAAVISKLIEIIIIKTPIIVVADDTNCIKLSLSVWLILSTSFVMRERMSPCERSRES